MVVPQVLIDGRYVEVVGDITIRRSAKSIVSTASFSTPLDFLVEAKSQASVVIKKSNREIFFSGNIQTYKLKYQGKKFSLVIQCSDAGYYLSAAERISFDYGTSVVDAIEQLVAGSGLSTSGIVSPSSGILPIELCVSSLESSRLDQLEQIAQYFSCWFYISYSDLTPIAVFNPTSTLYTTYDFAIDVELTSPEHTIIAFDLDSAPESPELDRATITVAGTPFHLFNRISLTNMIIEMGFPVSPHTDGPIFESWRVTDTTHIISPSVIITTAVLIYSDSIEYLLSIPGGNRIASSLDVTDMISIVSDAKLKKAYSRVGSVAGTGSGVVYVQYETGEIDTVDDHGVS